MIGAALLSTLHLFGLVMSVSSIFARARAFRRLVSDPTALDAVFFADNLWGLAGLLTIGTGLARAFGSFEKGSGFYLNNGAFLIKMALFGVVFALELYPMVVLIRWRIAKSRGQPLDFAKARLFERLSTAELVVTCCIPFVASMMARGIGFTWLS
jgi:putative membrane protein